MTFDPNATIVRLKRRIVPNWRSRLRDYSTFALAAGGGIVVAWTGLPADLKAHLPTEYVAWVVGALNVWGLGGKFITQDKPEADK